MVPFTYTLTKKYRGNHNTARNNHELEKQIKIPTQTKALWRKECNSKKGLKVKAAILKGCVQMYGISVQLSDSLILCIAEIK